MLNKGKYQCSVFSSTEEAISAWPLSNIFCINSRVCCCLFGSRFRLKSKDLALLSACSLLLAKGGRFGRKGRGAVHLPLLSFAKFDSITSMNLLSSMESPMVSSKLVFLKSGSDFVSTLRRLSQGSKCVERPLSRINVLLTQTLVGG